jgi:DHA1 family inner membrane transport protein
VTTSVKTSSSISHRFPYGGLFILSVAVFISVTAEMMPTGLLPQMSSELGVSEAQIGLLVTFFALSVVVTSVPLVSLTRRFSRHGLIVAVLIVVSLASLLSALSPSYEWLVAARILGGIAHGLFWAVVGAYSGHLVAKEHIGRAVAIITSGGTLAFVLGVPLATVVGQSFGWRVPFAAVSVLGVCAAVLILKFLPRVSTPEHTKKDARSASEPRRRRSDAGLGAVVLVCVTTAVIMVGHYALYTYITPFLTTRLGIAPEHVGAVLFANGAGGAVGLALVALLFGRRPMLGIVLGVLVTGVVVSVLAVFSANTGLSIAAIIIWGMSFGLLPSLLQARLLHVASARIRDTAVAFFSTSFNVGIAAGAVLGGALLSSRGLSSLPFANLALLSVAAVLLLGSVLSAHRRRGRMFGPTADEEVVGVAVGAAAVTGESIEGGAGTSARREGEVVMGAVVESDQAWGSKTTVTDAVGPNQPVDGSV